MNDMLIAHCQRCRGPYDMAESTSDHRFSYCSALCQSYDGEPFYRDILTWHRASLSPQEKADLLRLLSEPMREAGR